jgi:hypothetical protein
MKGPDEALESSVQCTCATGEAEARIYHEELTEPCQYRKSL